MEEFGIKVGCLHSHVLADQHTQPRPHWQLTCRQSWTCAAWIVLARTARTTSSQSSSKRGSTTCSRCTQPCTGPAPAPSLYAVHDTSSLSREAGPPRSTAMRGSCQGNAQGLVLQGPNMVVPDIALPYKARAFPKTCTVCSGRFEDRYGIALAVQHADLIPGLVGFRIFQAMPKKVRLKAILAGLRGKGTCHPLMALRGVNCMRCPCPAGAACRS